MIAVPSTPGIVRTSLDSCSWISITSAMVRGREGPAGWGVRAVSPPHDTMARRRRRLRETGQDGDARWRIEIPVPVKPGTCGDEQAAGPRRLST
jgi:hypothetical protein